MPFPVRSFIGPRTETGLHACGPISGTGLCQFRYGHLLGPVPKLDSMRVVPFPVRGSAILGRSFTGPRTKTGLYARWVRPLVGLWFNDNGAMDDDVNDVDGDGATGDNDDDNGGGVTGCDNKDKC